MVSLCLAAPALGGATELWAQAMVVLGIAGLMLWTPPRAAIPKPLAAILGGLVLLAGVAFLPAQWFPKLPFRTSIADMHNVPLAETWSMQPWQTLEQGVLLAAVVGFVAFLLGHPWRARRRGLLAIYAGGITSLAGIALLFYFVGWNPPLWQPANGALGFFPNRNQTGIVLASGGLISLALAFRSFLKKDATGYVWTAAYLIIAWALVLNRDRPTLLLFAAGCMLWLVWVTWRSERRALGLGLAAALLASAVAVEIGAWRLDLRRTASAQAPAPAAQPGAQRTDHPVAKIQKDALELAKDASWAGIGLGNFEPVFAHYRAASSAQNRVRHPENDWLWATIEMGWLAPALLLAGIIVWFRNFGARRSSGLESRRSLERYLRTAAAVSVLMFVADTFISVPGHRLGAVLPFLLLLALGGERRRMEKKAETAESAPSQVEREEDNGDAETDHERKPAGLLWTYRGIGIALACVALLWITSVLGLGSLPTSAHENRLRRESNAALQAGQFDLAIEKLNQALRWAPLDWQLYFQRGLAQINSQPAIHGAMLDFNRARFLEPNVAQVPFEEARVWLKREPRLVFGPWYEALRRSGERKVEYFRHMLEMSRGIHVAEEEMFSLTYRDPELLLVFLEYTTPLEFQQELDKLLEEDPALKTLTGQQQLELFTLWAQKGNAAALEQQLQLHPEWARHAWQGLALVRAAQGQYREACELLQRHASPPRLPPPSGGKSALELRKSLLVVTNDFSTAYALYQAQMRENETGLALDTVRRMTAQAGCPPYFHFLEANLAMAKEEWPAAWEAWARFLRMKST